MTHHTKPKPMLWLSDARGVYIPHEFAASFVDRARDVSGVSDEDWTILDEGPDHEWYWETWSDVCDNAIVTDGEDQYTIYQDGDCWLIPVGMEWSDSKEFFVWPSDDDDEDNDNE